MKVSALTLAPPPSVTAPPPTPVAFLTGDNYWEQTAFCLHSLQVHLKSCVRTIVIDDGSLRPFQAKALQRISPGLRIVEELESASRFADRLPYSRFPTLHNLWNRYKHIRKLTDPHLLGETAVLVLDSDMIFRAPPTELRAWLENPTMPIVMQDCTESYGYTREQLNSVCGRDVPPLVNVGITGLYSDTIDWMQWEDWCRTLLECFGMSYYLEQALVAMHLAFNTFTMLPGDHYAVIPDETSKHLRDPELVLGHYVADSKMHYFLEAWRS